MFTTTILTLSLLVTSTSQWPGFLAGDASQADGPAIPVEWSPSSNIRWQAALPGYGQSTPVVHGGVAYVTCVEGKMKEKSTVVAIDIATGSEKWRYSLDSSEQVESSTYVSRAAPTPVVDDDRLICFFESGDLVCLDHDGKEMWKRSLTKEYGAFQNRFCIGASPAQDAEKVFLLIDHEGPSYAMAVNKTNGETIWKTDRSGRMSWSSPSLLEIDGKPQLVASSAGSVDGYDPETGKQLWTYGDVGGNTAPTPIAAGKNQFLLGASPGPRGETRDQAARSNGLMRIEMQDGKPEAKLVWQAGKALSTFASPVVHQGFGYWVNQTGVVFCFDMQTGEEKYSERLAESCWATPVGIDDRIYFFGQKGNTTVIAAGPEHKQLAVNRLWEAEAAETNEGDRPSFGGRTQYGAVAVGDCLLVRTGDILYCVGK